MALKHNAIQDGCEPHYGSQKLALPTSQCGNGMLDSPPTGLHVHMWYAMPYLIMHIVAPFLNR